MQNGNNNGNGKHHPASCPAVAVTVPEPEKKEGVFYALTNEGWELPVIDILHPAFDDIPGPAALEAMTRQYLEGMEKFARAPRFVRSLMMWHMGRNSIMIRALRGAARSFLPGISTYIMKLGPGNLGRGYAHKHDPMMVASLPAVSLRIRLRNMARLAAEGLPALLEARPGRPLQILNIAGGPAIDSLNTLRLLRRDRPDVLGRRPVRIHVLDRDTAGPAFGARALAAWLGARGPLHGLDATLEHHAYDWTNPQSLETLSASWGLGESVTLACSEGGLFEYGDNKVIHDNLAVLGRLLPESAIMVGSVTRQGPIMRAMISASSAGHPTTPRTPEAFSELVQGAGWSVEAAEENLMSLDVRIKRG